MQQNTFSFSSAFLDDLRSIVVASLSDSGNEAREKGRQLFKMVADRWPRRGKDIFWSLKIVLRKKLRRDYKKLIDDSFGCFRSDIS